MLTVKKTVRKNGTKRIRMSFGQISKVEQHHKNDLNINQIMKRYTKTGLLPKRKTNPTYGNFVGVTDYHEAQNRLLQAETDFMRLPSDIRNRFENDPGLLLAFINKPDNEAEASEMGLIPKPAKDQATVETSTESEAEVPAEPVIEETIKSETNVEQDS